MAESATVTLPAQPRTGQARIWEIDALRGVAIVMMVIFHLMWDLVSFRVLPDVVLYAGFWKYFQRTTAILFITLVGVSLTVSYRRARAIEQQGDGRLFRKFLIRGLRIFGWGVVLSIIVWTARMGYVHFGVLHLIGFSIVAAYPLLRYRWLNLGLWALFNMAGYYLYTERWDFAWIPRLEFMSAFPWVVRDGFISYGEFPWLVWLGFQPNAYYPNDYFPVIPWFGVALLGVFIGNTLYDDAGRRFTLPDLSGWLSVWALRWLGRYSLTIYLLHQPALFLILMGMGIIRLG